MPDQPVEREGPEPYPHRLEMRVSRLEGDMSDVGASIARLDGRIGRLEATTERLDERLGRLEVTTERVDGRIGRLEAASPVSKRYSLPRCRTSRPRKRSRSCRPRRICGACWRC